MDQNKSIETVYFIPVVLILGVVPLIVIGKEISISNLEMLNWKGGSFHIDIYSYYKSLAFLVLIYGSFILLFIQQIFGRLMIKFSWIYLPVVVYMSFVSLSTMQSEYLPVSLMGFIEQFQGVWVLIGYALAIFVAYNMTNTEKLLKSTDIIPSRLQWVQRL
jgi:hypothetical protein